MYRYRGLLIVVGLAALMILGVACKNGEASTTPATEPATAPPASASAPSVAAAGPGQAVSSAPVATAPESPRAEPAPAIAVPEPAYPSTQMAATASGYGPYPVSSLLQTGSTQAGIWVTGEGTMTLEPDLALVNIGVETEARTVVDARDEAANAMDAIVNAVKARGLEDKDVQTRSFNIYPLYDYVEVTELGRRTSKRELVGYRVSNSAIIKVRDLTAVGDIIDDVATAGGDATRIDGVSFTVEDPRPYMVDLRAAAVGDALDKAQHFATLAGVSVGQLVYISETGGGQAVVQDFGMERALAAPVPAPAAAPTSISGGELELRLSVQAVFDIQ